jgi:hypothetical protein
VLTNWPSVAAALEADTLPCSPDCAGQHAVAFAEPGRVHVVAGGYDPKPTLAEALLAAGYRPPDDDGPPVEFWPSPREFNPRLGSACEPE